MRSGKRWVSRALNPSYGLVVALAYWIFGPLGALAVLVPRLGAHKRKAEEIKTKVEKAIEPTPE